MKERALVAAMVVTFAIITWQELTGGVDDFGGRGLPIPAPARYVDAGVVFGVLGLVAIAAPGAAAALGWGVLLAVLISKGDPLSAAGGRKTKTGTTTKRKRPLKTKTAAAAG